MKASIVIPVYNAALYLDRCLASVMAQTHPDLECILVDDGSTDGSPELAAKKIAAYAGSAQFKVIRHECNRGQSAARNTGIRAATGDYVYFMDSDDEIWPDTVARFVAGVREGEADFAVGEFQIEGAGPAMLSLRLEAGMVRGRDAILTSFLRGDWHTLAGNRFVRRQWIADHHLYFAEGLVHEDELWTLMLACKAQAMGVVKGPTYLYRIHGNSTMTANPARRFDAWLQILRMMEEFIMAEGLGGDVRLLKFLAIHRSELAERASRAGRDAFEVYRLEIRRGRHFDLRVFLAMGLGWKIRYGHYLLPCPAGYVYLWCAMRALPVLAQIKHMGSRPRS
jgi:glycosyltransferase involved in cell wall biosynthesis